VNNEGTLDYPDILIAGVGKTECWLNSQEHCSTHGSGFPCGLFKLCSRCFTINVIVGSLFDNLYSRILYSEMLWEINLWILILFKLKLPNLITIVFAYCLDYRLLTNEMFMQIYICSVIIVSQCICFLFGNFITNTSLAWSIQSHETRPKAICY
jgi:hypothetical protein